MNSAIEGETSSLKIGDALEFAQRIGMDAIGDDFVYWLGQKFGRSKDGNLHYVDGLIKSRDDLKLLEKPKDMQERMDVFNHYIKKAKGTGVGIYPRISAFFNPTYLAMGLYSFRLHYMMIQNL